MTDDGYGVAYLVISDDEGKERYIVVVTMPYILQVHSVETKSFIKTKYQI